MPPTTRIIRAVASGQATVRVSVDFGATTQSLEALRAAAYRLIGAATCEIEERAGRYICALSAVSSRQYDDADALKTDFLNLVTDENLREQIAARTDGVRNVILALAFGALANQKLDSG
jgi:His-Xaa-Ser system protein HxsD